MTTRELRIGNILTDGKFDFTIESIEQESVWGDIIECIKIEQIEDCYESGDYHFNIENIEGIPLTEEWLLKLGFVRFLKYKIYNKESFQIEKHASYKDGYIFFLDSEGEAPPSIKIKYVHQLQNLYFALTSEELTIQ